MTRKGVLLSDHRPTYPDPIEVRAGDSVILGRRDDEYPGWTWATAADGRCGWMPDSLFDVRGDRAVATRDYSARELAAKKGETVEVVEDFAGWARVVASDGRAGWIPTNRLRT